MSPSSSSLERSPSLHGDRGVLRKVWPLAWVQIDAVQLQIRGAENQAFPDGVGKRRSGGIPEGRSIGLILRKGMEPPFDPFCPCP